MFGSFIVEMVVGLLATFALLGLCVTTLTEVFKTYVKSIRAKNLQLCLQQLFTLGVTSANTPFFRRVVDHPLIRSMSPPGKQPSYLSSSMIADAVINLLTRADGQARVEQDLEALFTHMAQQIDSVEPQALRSLLQVYLGKAHVQALSSMQLLKLFKVETEKWIDAGMERAEGWSRRYAKALSLVIASVLCALLNINAIKITHALAIDPQLRRTLFEQAQKNEPQQSSEVAKLCEKNDVPARCRFDAARDSLATSLDIGWEHPPAWIQPLSWKTLLLFPYWLVGVAVSALAASMGGDYWYKLLSSVIRLTGPQPFKPKPDKD